MAGRVVPVKPLNPGSSGLGTFKSRLEALEAGGGNDDDDPDISVYDNAAGNPVIVIGD